MSAEARGVGRAGLAPDQEVHLGDNLIADARHADRAREGGAAPVERHLELQPVARHDLPPELRVVDASQKQAAVPARCLLQKKNARDL